MKHYDCSNEHIKVEQFYKAETQLELLFGIFMWWLAIHINSETAIISDIKITTSEDCEDGFWCAEVYWSP